MTTTLRMFYARALFVLVFLFLLFMTAFMGVAFAQEAGAVTVDALAPSPETYTGLAGYANTGLAGLAGSLALAVVTLIIRVWNMLPVWLTSNIDLKQTMDSLHWRENIREATHDALTHAAVKLKIDPKSIQSWEEKNAFLGLAGQFLSRFDPEIRALTVDALDKDKNGIPDFLEIALAKIAPQTVTIAPPEPTAPQGFMGTPEPRRMAIKPRAPDEAVDRLSAKQMAARLMKRPKGAVTQ